MEAKKAYQTPKSNLQQKHDSEELNNILIIAKRQQSLLLAFLAYILLAVLTSGASSELKPFLQLLILPTMLAIIVFTAHLTLRLYGKPTAIIMIILSIIPLVNFPIMLIANSRAIKTIKSRDFRVGLMGENTKDIQNAM